MEGQTKKAKKTISLIIYLLLQFLISLLQIFRVYSILKSFEIKKFLYFEKKSPFFFQKRGLFFLILGLKILFEKTNTQKLLNCLRNISWKFEVPSLKNLGRRYILSDFLNFLKNWQRKKCCPYVCIGNVIQKQPYLKS